MNGSRASLGISGLVVAVSLMLCSPAWAQCETAKVHSPDGALDTRFGWATAVSGDYMIAGAPDADVGSYPNAGRAFVLKHDGLEWVYLQELELPPVQVLGYSEYGYSVAIDGDVAVVGARNNAFGAGAAFAWRRNTANDEWEYGGRLLSAGGSGGDTCGYSVAVDSSSQDWIAVGCPGRSDVALGAGAVAMFWYNSSSEMWDEQESLTADAAEGDKLGRAIAMDGDWLVVGAEGTNGSAGAAAVFKYDGAGTWTNVQKLVALNEGGSSDAHDNDKFGHSVALRGDRIVCGAYYYDADGVSNVGAAYVFARDGDTWEIEGRLLADDRVKSDCFGTSVAVDGDHVVVGAPRVDPEGLSGAGAVYLFRFSGGDWVQEPGTTAAEPADNQYLGQSVSLDGDYLAVGAYKENSDTGAAFVFAVETGDDCNGSAVHDECEYYTGEITDTNNNGFPDQCECDNDNQCDDGLDCTVDTCNWETHRCLFTPNPGFCAIGGVCYTTGTENSENECQVCDEGDPKVWSKKADDTACTSDGNECTEDVCLAGACEHPNMPDITVCGDQTETFCDGADFCWQGTCRDNKLMDGTPCDPDGKDCTYDRCDDGVCVHPNKPVGTPCGESADDECTDPDWCLADGTCWPNDEPAGTSCSDGLACNGHETCSGDGVCEAGEPECNRAGLVCEETVEDPFFVCLCQDAAACDDGLFCTGVETCEDGICVSSGDPCDAVGLACDEVDDVCRCSAAIACDDGIFCNGSEDCVDGVCVAGTPIDCSDGIDCTADVCSEIPDGYTCSHDPNDALCDNGVFCDGAEVCVSLDGCVAGTYPCEWGEICDEENDVCITCDYDEDCDDGDECTADQCLDGKCVHTLQPWCGVGACCLGGGCLEHLSWDFCGLVLGGVFGGDGTVCDDGVCEPGACCLPLGDCVEVVETACLADGGVFNGRGVLCSAVDCPVPPGACCVFDVCVPDQAEDDCLSVAGGEWVGPATVCTDGLCPLCYDGDADADGDVDLLDFAYLQICLDWEGVGDCKCVDMDNAGGVDLTDFGYFRAAITGP